MTQFFEEEAPYTFVVITRPGFDINALCAASPIRLGYMRGFAQIGIPSRLVSVFEVERVLPKIHQPLVFLSGYEYMDMTSAAREMLRGYPHFVWIDVDYEVIQEIYGAYGITQPRPPEKASEYILESNPSFVFTEMTPSSLKHCSFWQRSGLRLVSLPLACDVERYYPDPMSLKYSGTKMAYVGGYWPAKAIQFDKYLRPYENMLTVFGYNAWPYIGYRGALPIDDERILYQNARVCPVIGTPCTATIGEISERIFKVMGSGGLAVTDVTPAYRELFTEDELLAPESMDEYHNMIQRALSNDESVRGYRERGRQAILERHTYAHRAKAILGYLGIDAQVRKEHGEEPINT